MNSSYIFIVISIFIGQFPYLSLDNHGPIWYVTSIQNENDHQFGLLTIKLRSSSFNRIIINKLSQKFIYSEKWKHQFQIKRLNIILSLQHLYLFSTWQRNKTHYHTNNVTCMEEKASFLLSQFCKGGDEYNTISDTRSSPTIKAAY